MTSRRLLKKFWGRANRGRQKTMSVSLCVVASLHFAAESRCQNLHVLFSWWWCWYCYWSSAVSDEIRLLTLTLLCLTCSVWWLMSEFLKFSPLRISSGRQATRWGECIYCHVVLVQSHTNHPQSKIPFPKKKLTVRGAGVSSFPPPRLLVVYHAVAKWWRGHAPCLTKKSLFRLWRCWHG